MGFQVAYIPIGVPTYHLETAREQFEQSKAMLSSISEDCVFPADILLSIDDIRITDMDSLKNVLFAHEAGDLVTVSIYRNGNTASATVALAEDKG